MFIFELFCGYSFYPPWWIVENALKHKGLPRYPLAPILLDANYCCDILYRIFKYIAVLLKYSFKGRIGNRVKIANGTAAVCIYGKAIMSLGTS